MSTNKVLRTLSIIFECSFIGSVILYIYNYYISNKKYEIMPDAVKSNLNIFVIIAVMSLILFLILKYVLYLRNKTVSPKVSQIRMNFNERSNIEEISKNSNIQDKSVERVIIYKDSYDVPKNKRMICPNCNNIIDKSAFICLKCGILLRNFTPVEKRIERNYIDKPIDKIKLRNMVINAGLIIAIILCLVFIIDIAIERGIIK